MRSRPPRRLLLAGLATGLFLQASPCLAQRDPGDPWEKMNRRFFGLQEVLDRNFFGPLARSYSKTPSPVRGALRNFARNLGEPLVAVNDLLQGHIGTAASTVGRFVINSTVGIAGFADPATAGRIPYHQNTFGTTLGRWGAKPGPYLFLPLVGPSDVRDGLGSLADIGLNPITYVHYNGKTAVGISTTVINGLDRRLGAQQDLETIRATSTDPYATLRSFFLQNREAEITGKTEIGPLPELEETPEPVSPEPAPGEPPPEPQPAPQPAPPAPTDEAAPPPLPETPPPAPRGSVCQPPP